MTKTKLLKNRLLGCWFCALCWAGGGPALAHRLPECLTTVEAIQSENRIEVVHRLHRHDAEAGLAQRLREPNLRLEDLQTRAMLALYVEEHFALSGQLTTAPLPLHLIGAELDGDYVLVYQEYVGALPATLFVRNDILRERNANQVNLVHIKFPQRTQRLVFAGDVGWLPVGAGWIVPFEPTDDVVHLGD